MYRSPVISELLRWH
jgi:hypothetical protein